MNYQTKKSNLMIVVAWISMLMVSILPNIILKEIFQLNLSWLLCGKLAFLGFSIILSFFIQWWKPLHHFFIILAGILLIDYSQSWLINTDFWNRLFYFGNKFVRNMFPNQAGRVLAALLMIGLLFTLRYKCKTAYLVHGKLDAPVGKIKLFGFKEGEIKWSRFGWLSALAIGSGSLLFLILGGSLQFSDLRYLPKLLPSILLFAVMNALYEEVFYRSAVIATLNKHLGKFNLIWIPAVFFGVGHFYGVPYGILGVVMAIFLGWLLSKSMVETKGFFWPWFIHFVQDVLIFSFMALGAVVPGG